MKRVFLIAAGVLALNGCGGGGNSATESAEISGKIIDGYISGAQIFWDCNTNSIADANEISTTSSNGGNYSISPAPNASCRLTASIPASAIDSDTNSSVLHPYLMYALGDNPALITPLTTLVVLNSSSSNQSIVASEIKQKFNLALSIDTDYLSGSTDGHVNDRKFAKVTAQLLQGNYSSISSYDSNTHQKIVDSVTSLKDTIQKASVSDVIQNIINIPSAALKRFFRSFYTDPTLGVKINDVGLTSTQSSYLQSLIVDARVTPFIAGGAIDWKRMDLATLTDISSSLTANGFPPNPEDLKAERVAKQRALDEKYKPLLADANQFITLDSESIGALFDIADSMIKGGYGVAKMASVAPNVSGVFNYVNMTPGTQGQLIKNLDKLSKYSGFATKATACGFSISEFRSTFSDSSVSPDDYLKALQGTSSLVGCLGSIVDDAPLGKGIKYVVDLFTAGSTSERDRVDAALTLLDTLNMIINMTPPTPFSNFTSGFLDVMSAGFNSYSAGLTISDQAGKKWLVTKSAIEDLQKAEDNLLNREYFARYIKSKIGAGIVRADWKLPVVPTITDLTFTPATANTAAKITALFSTDMQSGYHTTGDYSPMVGKEGYWPDARTFVAEFSSVTSGGQITLVASGFKSVSGQPMAADRVYTFPVEPTNDIYVKISNSGVMLPNSALLGDGPNDWSCTMIRATGVIWEVKRQTGFQASDRLFTYYTSSTELQKYDGQTYSAPTSQEIASSDNVQTYISAANGRSMCGRSNWSLGTPVGSRGLGVPDGVILPADWFGNAADPISWWTGGIGYSCPFGGCAAPQTAFGHYISNPYSPCYYGCNTHRSNKLGAWLMSTNP